MDRYACGDESAFAELYDLLAPRLFGFLMRQTRDRTRTEDLVQQTLLQMHCARRHFIRGAAVLPWAYAIARRIHIDALRRTKREVLRKDDDDGESNPPVSRADAPDEMALSKELAARMRAELERVPESHRIAFELVRQDGMSHAEAAEVLGTTANAVKLRTHRT